MACFDGGQSLFGTVLEGWRAVFSSLPFLLFRTVGFFGLFSFPPGLRPSFCLEVVTSLRSSGSPESLFASSVFCPGRNRVFVRHSDLSLRLPFRAQSNHPKLQNQPHSPLRHLFFLTLGVAPGSVFLKFWFFGSCGGF